MNFKLNNVAFLPFLAVIFLMSNFAAAYDVAVNTGSLTGEISVVDDFTGQTQNYLLGFHPGSVVACVPMTIREIENGQRRVFNRMELTDIRKNNDYSRFLEENPLKYVVFGIPSAGEVQYNYSFDAWRVEHRDESGGRNILAGLGDKEELLSVDSASDDNFLEIEMTTDSTHFPAIYSEGRLRKYSEYTAWNNTNWHSFSTYGSDVKLRVASNGYGEITATDNRQVLFVLKCKESNSRNMGTLRTTLGVNANLYDFVKEAFPWAD